MESWLKSHTHTHTHTKRNDMWMWAHKIWLDAKVHVHSKWMFLCYASKNVQNCYHVLLCIENSTNYKSLLLTVSFYMLSLRWDSLEASWDLRIFNSSSISYLIFYYLFLIFAPLCKLVICMSVLSPILILEVLQLCTKIINLTLCSFQS